MTVVFAVCIALLSVAGLLLVTRIALGPTTLDRAVALDMVVAAVICGLALEAAINRHSNTLPVLIVLSFLGFTGSVAVARFTRGNNDIEAERR